MTCRPPELDALNQKVTAAIFHAERLPEGEERRAAFHQVSLIEEEIASVMPASSLEGSIARHGVVTAALSAGNRTRAIERAEHYLEESSELARAPELRGAPMPKLQELLDEAKAMGAPCLP